MAWQAGQRTHSPSLSWGLILAMTKANLSGARAKLKWADSQINILDGQIRDFIEKNVETIPPYPNFTHGQILRNDRVIPDEIKASTGMIVQAQRDSLDHLAHALAVNNKAVKLTAVEFPICDTQARFADKGTRRKIAELSAVDQAAIIALKPYKGGNNVLYALHWLSNKSKHRDLIAVAQNLASAGWRPRPGSGGGYIRRFAVWTPDKSPNKDGTVIMMDADPQIEFYLAFTIAFREIPETGSQPVVETLREFSRLANSIIDLFD
jgi:hypothetical protein